MEQITGVEPASSAWEADVLPMNYIRIITIIYLFFTIVNSVCVIKRGQSDYPMPLSCVLSMKNGSIKIQAAFTFGNGANKILTF